MDLIIETDIGHDPDDFFALCYFFSVGVNVRAILISPGDESQVAIVRFLLSELGREDVVVGVPELGRRKEYLTSIHKYFIIRYNYPRFSDDCCVGEEILHTVFDIYPQSELFICGAIRNIGNYLIRNENIKIPKAVMQGGFIGYDTHGIDVPKLDKFIGKESVPTFNLNGYVRGSQAFLNHYNIGERWFVSKNVCHTAIYDSKIHEKVTAIPAKNRAMELFQEGMTEYLRKHPKGKKFHDPTAAVCHLHPEIGTWVKARLYRYQGGWGSRIDGNGDNIIVDIDHKKLWDYIAKGK